MIAHLIAQATPDGFGVLINYGPLGVMLAWFMLRFEKLVVEIRSLSHRLDGLTKALLMDLVSRDSTGPATRAQAQQEIAKIEARISAATPSR